MEGVNISWSCNEGVNNLLVAMEGVNSSWSCNEGVNNLLVAMWSVAQLFR